MNSNRSERKSSTEISRSAADITLPVGGEAFTPPLHQGQRYVIEIRGSFLAAVARHFLKRDDLLFGDALYWRDDTGARRHKNLTFNNREPHQLFIEDREDHRYSFAVIGSGQKLSLQFARTFRLHGILTIQVRHPTEDECALIGWSAPRATPQIDLEAVLRRRQAEEIAELVHLYELRPHLADPKHLENLARSQMADLISRSDAILGAYKQFHRRGDFVAALKQSHPEIYERCIWEAKALAWAERFAVEPPEPAAKRRPARRKPADLAAQRYARKGRTQLGKLKKKLELRQEAREMIDRFNLDDEERTVVDHEVDDMLDTLEDDHAKEI